MIIKIKYNNVRLNLCININISTIIINNILNLILKKILISRSGFDISDILLSEFVSGHPGYSVI